MNSAETARIIEIARAGATGDDLAFVESVIRKRAHRHTAYVQREDSSPYWNGVNYRWVCLDPDCHMVSGGVARTPADLIHKWQSARLRYV